MGRHSALYVRLINCAEWRRLRLRKLEANPICEMCEAEGFVVPAREVHHIKEVDSATSEAEARQLAYSWNNLQSLCHACHKKVHIEKSTWSKEGQKKRRQERLERFINKYKK